MLARWLPLVGLALLSSCLDTTVPPAPILGPGTVRATVMTARAGRAEVEPAVGATLTLVGTSQTATVDADGNVRLSGITETRGRLLFALDADGDGAIDQSRVMGLEAVSAGFGRDVNLGQVVLSRNATIVGRVRRGDRNTLPTGHGGISVFLPQLPQLSWSGDDGSFEVRGAPEGNLVLSFFTQGYRPVALALSVGAGQEVRVADVELEADPGASPIGRLIGTVTNREDGTPVAAVQVRAASNGVESQAQSSAEGTFALETLPTGLYPVSLARTGLLPLRLDNVLVAPGVNDLGVLHLSAGGGAVSLDGGPTIPDAGEVDAGAPDAGTADSGTPDAGVPDAGTPDAGTPDSGTPDAGIDAGAGPIAVVDPTLIVARSAVATLDGSRSVGDFPLRYRWTQLTGPTVTLSANDSVTAHRPTFTAPTTATQLEFALEVSDRNGVVSTNTATTRVIVSSVPVARFVPDGGLVFGGQTIALQSTSFDDGGLVLINHDWRLGSGSTGTLVADGGPLAQVTFPPVMVGDSDLLTRVELQVTNAVGVPSSTFARDFTVRAPTSSSWSVVITPVAAVDVGAAPPTVNLAATFTLPAGTPTPSVSWSCTPSTALVGANTLTPSFIAPVVTGPSFTVTCTVVATAAAPLQPTTQSAMTIIIFNDARPPTFVSLEELSVGPWGRSVRFSEPMSTASANAGGCFGGSGQSGPLLPIGSWGVPNLILDPGSCGSFTVSGSDRGTPARSMSAVNVGGVVGRVVWEGPFVSSTLFDDPRPVLPSLSQAPEGTYELAGTPLPRAPGVELLASAPGTVYRFAIDARVADAGCVTPCPLTETPYAMPWVTGGQVATRRAWSAGDSLFTSFNSDSGVALLERLPDGGLQGPMFPPGQPVLSRYGGVTQLDAVEFDGGAIDRWRWDPPTRQWQRGARIATGLSSVEELSGNEFQVFALVGPSRTLTAWTYGVNPAVNPNVAAWYNYPTPTQLSAAPAMRDISGGFVNWSPTVFMIFYSRPNGAVGMYRVFDTVNEFNNPFVADRIWSGNANVPIVGFDWVARGQTTLGVRAENGQILLSTISYSGLSGGAQSSTTYPGPPRAGPGPYPQALNVDLACEGAWPRMAMVDDRLFITWQERCAPETRWRVVMRVVR